MRPGPTQIARIAALTAVALVLAGCGGGGGGGDRTSLQVDGIVTRAGVETSFEGRVTCTDGRAAGSGSLDANAEEVCRRLRADPDAFDEIGRRADRLCTQLYGGPQRARVRGRVEGTRVDVRFDRSDGCGIADWDELEWLLGRPDQ